MKLLQILGVAALVGAVGCQSQAAHEHDHWSPYSLQTSMSRALLSYDPEVDGSYLDFQWEKKKSINLTLRRHFLNSNPENPFEADDPDVFAPRPNHSIVPHPWNYIHVEGLVFGGIMLGMSGGFVPIPVDSLIATFSEGGDEEFINGVGETVSPIGIICTSFLHDSLGFTRRQPDRPSQ